MALQIVKVAENVESGLPIGIEQGAKYVLRGPDGTRATFNDPSEIDHVGFLTEPPSGLDSPEVRESSDLIVEGDGGVHGNFYFGRRPWTLTGIIDPVARQGDEFDIPMPALVNRRVTKLMRATRALRGDCVLGWTPQGGVPVELAGRRQGLRVSDRLPKAFQFSAVSSERRIQSSIVHSIAAPGADEIVARNDGNTVTPWTATLLGAWTDPILTAATGEQIRLTENGGIATVGGDVIVIEGRAKTIEHNGVSIYSRLAFPASRWFELVPGDNPLNVSGGGVGASWRVDWRDSWE